MKKAPIAMLTALAVVIVLFSSVYTVSQTEQAILIQFGKPVGDPSTTPGSTSKSRSIQTVYRFDKRWLEYDGDANQIRREDKKYIWVDIYARWRIKDPLRFYQAVEDERGAQSRLDDIVDGETRNAVASFDLIEVVRSSNRPFQATEELAGNRAGGGHGPVGPVARRSPRSCSGRHLRTRPSSGCSSKTCASSGSTTSTPSREGLRPDDLRAEAHRRAEPVRGPGARGQIRGQKERDMLAACSAGYRTAQEVKGKADAKATAIYAKAYGRDPEFYQFTKAMETLNASLDDRTWLILSTDSELLKYLRTAGAGTN